MQWGKANAGLPMLQDGRMEIATINPGVFFTAPQELPRGRHTMEREAVLLAQRERLMIAVSELMASGGYRSVGVRQITSRAHISRAAFYECFDDKDGCVLAAYDRFIEVLLAAVGAAFDEPVDWETTVRDVVDAYLQTLQSDLVVARAFQVEMDAIGRDARQRRQTALVGMAQVLKAERDRVWPGDEQVPESAYVGAVYAVRQLASDQLDATVAPDLPVLAPEVAAWIGRMLREAAPATNPA